MRDGIDRSRFREGVETRFYNCYCNFYSRIVIFQ